MAELPIRFDATRLLARAHHATPTGIDRVDLAYAQALLARADRDVGFVAFGGLGGRRLRDDAARRLVDETAARGRTSATEDTATFAALSAWLATPFGTPRPPARAIAPVPARRGMLDRLWRGLALRDAALDATPVRYVHSSHGQLHRPAVDRWLHRSGSCGVFFVHDLIPITHPQYNRPAEPARHAARLRTVAAHAQTVIVNSAVTAAALTDWLHAERLRVPPVEVIPLGVADAFARLPTPPPDPASTPYFVVLGTLEPRKNHALLLRLWPRLVARLPQGARLLCIGRRGWENAALLHQLDTDAQLRPWVAEGAGLSDHEVARLLRGARALLAPSFTEGFHLPVAEALACGCPVLGSDIPAHREVGGGIARLLDVDDEDAWLHALADYADRASTVRAAQLVAMEPVRPLRWSAHVERALRVILAE